MDNYKRNPYLTLRNSTLCRWNIFETIGTVNAKGAEAENVDYTFLDDQPLSQQNLYLLKMVDDDGSFQFSEIVNITTLVNDQFEVYPNPVNGILTIHGDWDANATFQIIDMAGNIIYTKHTTSATNSVLQVDFSNYAPGIYIVQLISTHGIFHHQLLKLNKRYSHNHVFYALRINITKFDQLNQTI